MLAEWLISEYEDSGYLAAEGELYLPLTAAEEFVYDCNRLNVGIIGVNFVLWTDKDLFLHLGSLDLTELLPHFENWEQLVQYCNNVVLEYLEKEREANYHVFFVPYLLEEYEWIMKKIMGDFSDKLNETTDVTT